VDDDFPDDLLRLAEAFVFASPEPVTERALGRVLPAYADPRSVLEALERRCAGRGVILVEAGGTWRFRTAADLAPRLRPALAGAKPLPEAALEVLAAIAIYSPVTRPEIERARGVSVAQTTVDLLVESGLIRPCGRRDGPGRPTLWAVTPEFLARFGLRSLWDLPGAGLPLPPGPGSGVLLMEGEAGADDAEGG
jgi:segregation and condensation protein B